MNKFVKSLKVSLLVSMLATVGLASAQAHEPSGNAAAQINGGLANSISVNAFSNGIGNVQAVAGSTGSTGGMISATGSAIPGSGGVYDIKTNASASVDTKTTGYVGLAGSGNATGLASMTGWTDGGGTVVNQGQLGSNLTFNGAGSVDSGRPINVMHGPDVALSTTTLGTGVTAVGVSGGSVAIGGAGNITDNGGTRTVSLTDTKDVSSYAATNFGALTLNGTPLAIQNGSVTQLNAGAEATANVTGQYNIGVSVNVAPNGGVSNAYN